MSSAKHPVFFELSRDESIALLGRNFAGRLAFTFHDRVDIEPISYVHDDEWLYARTSLGTKLDMVRHHPWVAFEVDEIAGRYDWRSVVVRGTIYFLDPDAGERERERFDRGVSVLRRAEPEALGERDPTPERRHVFRIHMDEVNGRGARPA